MALSSTPSSNETSEGSQQYPYPWQVNAASFVSVKLLGPHNYVAWREQVWCLLDSHDMLGFIDGTITKPEAECRGWKRSDLLVKGWIYGSLDEYVMGTVVGLQTANDVWKKLEADYTIVLDYTTPLVSAPIAPPPVATPTAYPPQVSNINIATVSHTASRRKELGEYVPLCRAIETGDWEKTQELFNEDKDALTDKLNFFGSTPLHIAIGNPDNTVFLENLLEQINPESLPTLVNNNQQNALHLATVLDNTIAAKKLVEKNPNLLFAVDNQMFLPIQAAVNNSHKNTFLYLLEMCKQHIELSQKEGYYNPFEGQMGANLLVCTILAGFLDIAYDFLQEYPELARTKGSIKTPLWCMAKIRDAYPSAKQYNIYKKIVYSYVPVKKTYGVDHTYKIQDIENHETCATNPLTERTKSYVYSVMRKIYVKFWKVALLHVPHIKNLHEDKVQHNKALMLLKFICAEVGKLKSNPFEHYGEGYLQAISNDIPEVVEQIIRVFPESIWTDYNGYTLSQLSIINRCEKVYNFWVHKVTHSKYLHNVRTDNDQNNLLHSAGNLAPAHKLNMVTGAALQMQRELQWFQEVSKLLRPKEKDALNKQNETPIMVFRKQHEDLRQKGEDWLKKTADSYTITAALIITIAFAAAITVPGGTNGDTGRPVYKTSPSFIIFIISDAISMFTSTTSLLLFLSILTARYAEEDFLRKLPKRLILGLVMLFMSVTTMLIAFSATLYIMFDQEKSWILVPIATITCLPIASFVTLQLPLLYDLISSTYGSGIFGKRSERRITS